MWAMGLCRRVISIHFMRLLFIVTTISWLSAADAAGEAPLRLGPSVTVQRLTTSIWMHTSTQRDPGGLVVPSNGLVKETDRGSILIDTAWNDEQTERICRWVADVLHKPVYMAIVTHAHNDRIGGVKYLLDHGIKVIGLKATRDIALARKMSAPDRTFELPIGQSTELEGIELFNSGPGHAPDNIVVWFSNDKLLFGGCLVKSMEAKTLGFLGDADLGHWPKAIEALKERYAAANVIVPGHGETGGRELLDHTLELLAGMGPTTKATGSELLH
jgi:metallo-beta-lactamase class B